jgi:hypothetical protein
VPRAAKLGQSVRLRISGRSSLPLDPTGPVPPTECAATSRPRYSGLVKTLDEALQVIQAFNDEGVDYVVVGGVAINLHGLVRATEDLDVFVRPDPENIARMRRALASVWDDPEIEQITAEDLCGDYPAVRYGPPTETFYLDILTRLGEATSFADLEAEEKQVGTIRVRLATPMTLYRMKKDTVRPIDHADAAALRSAFGLKEE